MESNIPVVVEDNSFTDDVVWVQSNLKAPKGQHNKSGKYNYRNAEDILEAVKPLLAEKKMVLNMTDNVLQVGERFYIQAIVSVIRGKNSFSSKAIAREPDRERISMSEGQVTGTASSYARKYALNGLFAIDCTKDSDSYDEGKKKIVVAPKDFVVSIDVSFKGKELKEVPKDVLEQTVEWLEKKAHEKNQKIDGPVKEFIEMVDKFLGA